MKDYPKKQSCDCVNAIVVTTMIFMVLIALITTSGCKKCASCTTTVTQTVTGQQPVMSQSTTELCGDDLKEADGNVTTATSTYQGHTATVVSKTQCN